MSISGTAGSNADVQEVSEVTVALTGDAKSPPPGAIEWFGVRWEDAPKITLRVSGDETLADILDSPPRALSCHIGSPKPWRDRASRVRMGLDERCDTLAMQKVAALPRPIADQAVS
jgi:hypothetical protein